MVFPKKKFIWWHGVVGLLRFRGLLVGLWARGRGCQ